MQTSFIEINAWRLLDRDGRSKHHRFALSEMGFSGKFEVVVLSLSGILEEIVERSREQVLTFRCTLVKWRENEGCYWLPSLILQPRQGEGCRII